MKKSDKTKLEQIQEAKHIENGDVIETSTEVNPYELIKQVIELYKVDYDLLKLGGRKKTKKTYIVPTVDNFILRLDAKSDLFSKGNIPGITIT